jgi:phage portal protein BeeE
VIYVDEPGISDAQGKHQHAKATKQALISEYTGTKNQGKIAVSPYKMGVANLGLSPVELGIIEAEKWDAVLLCAIYGVPPELIGVVSKTYNNVVEAEKALTSRSALPLLTSHRDNSNKKLQTDWGFRGQNVYVDYDVSVYTELQEDVNQILDWTNKLIAVRPNEQRTLAGLEADPDPLMDQLWVTTAGRQPLEDYQIGAVDEALNPDNENVA